MLLKGNVLIDLSVGHATLAYYNLIKVNIISLITVIPSSLISIYIPLYSPLFAENKIEEIQKFANKIEKYIQKEDKPGDENTEKHDVKHVDAEKRYRKR